MNRRHCIVAAALALVSTLVAITPCLAGYDAQYRKSCSVLAKFRLRAELNYHKGGTYSHYYCPGGCVDKGCSFAEVNEEWWDNQSVPAVLNASIKYRIGSGKYAPITYTLNSYYSAGNAFEGVTSSPPPVDSLGVARASLTCDVTVQDDPGGGTQIILNNFSGSIRARSGSPFGASFRCIAWKGTSVQDTVIRPGNLQSDGGIRIEMGQVVATGFFSSSDFLTSTVLDTASGYTVLAVSPKPGLSKSIHVGGDNSDNSVALSQRGDVGYGQYNPNFIFAEEGATAFAPGLTPVGVAVAGAMLLLAAAAWQRKRRSEARPSES